MGPGARVSARAEACARPSRASRVWSTIHRQADDDDVRNANAGNNEVGSGDEG